MANLDRRKSRILPWIIRELRQGRDPQACRHIGFDYVGIGCCQDNIRRDALGLEGAHH